MEVDVFIEKYIYKNIDIFLREVYNDNELRE